MEIFFAARGYPNDLIRRGRERASTKSRAENKKNDAANIATDRVPFVTTFHPSNLVAEKIISRNSRIFREDSKTRNNKPPLKAFRHAKNLTDLLVRSSLPRNLVLNLLTGPFAAHVPMLIHHPQLQHQNAVLPSWDIFQASRNTWFIAYRAPNVHQQRILGRLDAG